MKKAIILALAAALAFAACGPKAEEQKVNARYVPERADDFVFENNLIAGRIYGQALEGNPTSPGIDLWVKRPGKLVADEWYAAAQEDGDYYHHDHGDGKDCYKVSTSLGAGASAALIGGQIQYPATNYRSWEVIEQTPSKVVFTLHYPEWEAADSVKIALDKTITVEADTYFTKVEDVYTFSGADSLQIAAGIFRHPDLESIAREYSGNDRYAIWEHASDQSKEPEDGMIGVAVCVPGAEFVTITEDGVHGLVGRSVVSGETFSYTFGSCWSKGDVQDAESWFDKVKAL